MRRPAGSGAVAQRAQARRQGREFERELDATHAALVAAGAPLALARGHPPVGGTPATGLYFAGEGTVDYVGTYAGRPVAFDAKNEAGAASYRWDREKLHELDFLLAFRRAGGAAFALLRDVEAGRVYLLDDLVALRTGAAVPLRHHARDGGGARVRCLARTAQERLVATASGRPMWDWTALVGSGPGGGPARA